MTHALDPPWTVHYRPHAEGVDLFTCQQAGQTLATMLAPTPERPTIGDVLAGKEYPLSRGLIEIVRGLPVLDIGAHCGSASAFFQMLLEPSRIVAFEPNPAAASYYRHNHPAHTLVEKAVASHDRGAVCYDRGTMYLNGVVAKPLGAIRQFEVETLSGLAAIQLVEGEIGVLKIDAENSEGEILLSMLPDLHRCRLVFIEYHNEVLRRVVEAVMGMDFMLAGGHAMPHQGVYCYLNYRFLEALS